MSILKRLFGLGSREETPAGSASRTAQEVEHQGFLIKVTPLKAGGQFQVCGVITREIDGAVKQHRFIRADRFAAWDDVVDVSIRKGRQLIDEQGDRLFAD
jgi:hypothetical protein